MISSGPSGGKLAETWPLESLLSARALPDKSGGAAASGGGTAPASFGFALRLAPAPHTASSLLGKLFAACAGPFGVRKLVFSVKSASQRDEIVERLGSLVEQQQP